RQHIRREKESGRDESGPPQRPGVTGRIAEVADHRPRRDEPAERAGPGKPQAEPGSAGLDWRVFYASHFPVLGSIAIVVPLLILAAATSRIIIYTQLTPLGVMAVLGLAGIAGSAIDYRNGCGVSAVAVGLNCAWLSGYAIFWLEIVNHYQVGSPNLLTYLYAL